MKIEYTPIGFFETPFEKLDNMPIQPSGGADITGTIVIDKMFTEGLDDLAGFSHIIVLSHLHGTCGYKLKVKPFLDDQLRGVFATRAPKRPNSIGLSVMKLVDVSDNIITVQGVDMLNGTPVLDIKPYVGDFDHCEDERFGWLEGKSNKAERQRSDKRFTQE